MAREILITWGQNQHLMALLAASAARVLVIGGTAVRFYAPERRDPNDLDLLIEPTEVNATKVLRAMETVIGRQLPIVPEALAGPSKVVREKMVLNVDVMTPHVAFDFAEAWGQGEEAAIAYASTPARVRVAAIPSLLAWLRYARTAEPSRAEAIESDMTLLETAASLSTSDSRADK
jgi:hypothetical protein